MRRVARGEPADDRGAVIILFAIALVALLVLSSLVVDLGLLRAQRRANQSAADLSALAAGQWLSGRNAATPAIRPRSACEAALLSVRANIDDFPSAATLNCSLLPVLGSSPSCHGTSLPVSVTAAGAAPYALTVTYPVTAAMISQSEFAGGSGVNDGGRCERMEVTIGYVQKSLFAGVLGVDSVDTEVTAVVRGKVDSSIQKVPALLLLDRTGCQVLTNSVGGAGNLGIIVSAASATEGGTVHADTDASDCGGPTTDYAVYGSPLSGGGTSITVEDSSGGDPGTITLYATTVGNPRDVSQYPAGVSKPGTPGGIISRQPVDNRYNPLSRTAIADLHVEARTRVLWTSGVATANGYTVLGCGDRNGTWTDTKVFVRLRVMGADRRAVPQRHRCRHHRPGRGQQQQAAPPARRRALLHPRMPGVHRIQLLRPSSRRRRKRALRQHRQ